MPDLTTHAAGLVSLAIVPATVVVTYQPFAENLIFLVAFAVMGGFVSLVFIKDPIGRWRLLFVALASIIFGVTVSILAAEIVFVIIEKLLGASTVAAFKAMPIKLEWVCAFGLSFLAYHVLPSALDAASARTKKIIEGDK